MTNYAKKSSDLIGLSGQFTKKDRTKLASSDCLSNNFSVLLWTFSFAAPLLIIIFLSVQQRVPADVLFRDPLAAADAPFYYGLVSNLGIMVWCASSAICLFSCLLVLRRQGWDMDAKFLLAAGAFTALLMMDDLFMLHEVFFPYIIGIPELVTYAIYASLGILYVFAFRRFWMTLAPLTFLASLALLAASVLADVVVSADGNLTMQVVEDGSKFLGICQWGAFHFRACLALTTRTAPA